MKEGKKHISSVRSRIFRCNALMILVMIAVCGIIGTVCVKLYWEKEEQTLQESIGGFVAQKETEEFIEGLTVHNENFILMAVLFALLSIVAMIVVSSVFMRILSKKIMKPLDILENGARRIREDDYSTPVEYHGDLEFEQVCEAFNEMQYHLKDEKEKNARYEKARQEMIAGISHDLRSPLTAVRGSVKGILDGVVKEPEQQRKFLEAAYRRSGDMDVLLNELFYFSKLETGGIPVNNRELDLVNYLQSYVDAKRNSPDFSGVEFAFAVPEEIKAPALADPEALQRILDNIVGNSKKYASASPLRIFVTVQEKDGCQTIIVQDNGVGVPEDRLGRIFEEFYRVDESRGRKEGSGLGLYIVKYLCEAMGGHVKADQESHCEGFGGLAVSVELKEAADGREGQDTDR
ncbi:MAG: HAMP domain-containing sensor histidine kinase [Eubacteriales bacterium]